MEKEKETKLTWIPINDRTRVSRDGSQWILDKKAKKRDDWDNRDRTYFGTLKQLFNSLLEHCPEDCKSLQEAVGVIELAKLDILRVLKNPELAQQIKLPIGNEINWNPVL